MSYNGWKNRETWNVALWIGNDEGLYNVAMENCDNYGDFVEYLDSMGYDRADSEAPGICFETPDGVAWNDSGLDIAALDEMIAEL